MEFHKPDLKWERLRREQLWRVSASRHVYITWWRGLPFLASMNLVFGLAGPYGSFHPAMSTMHHLDPEFLHPKEMIMAYASQVHHVPNLPASASNSQRVQALYDSGGSRCVSPYQPDFEPNSLRPSTIVVKTMGGALKTNQMEGTL
jgi:hypothetical protein